VRFKAAGYRSQEKLVSASDTSVEVTLAKAKGSKKPGAKGHPGEDSSTDEDPYGKVDDLKKDY
jgi:hypothetical protein